MRKLLTATAALLLVMPAPALAQTLPPGNSGVDEYTEGVPGAGGETPSSKSGDDGAGAGGETGGSGPGGSSDVLPEDIVSELTSSGADGKAAAALAEQTAPSPAAQAPVDADSGLGALWFALLGAALLGALAVLAARRRGPTESAS